MKEVQEFDRFTSRLVWCMILPSLLFVSTFLWVALPNVQELEFLRQMFRFTAPVNLLRIAFAIILVVVIFWNLKNKASKLVEFNVIKRLLISGLIWLPVFILWKLAFAFESIMASFYLLELIFRFLSISRIKYYADRVMLSLSLGIGFLIFQHVFFVLYQIIYRMSQPSVGIQVIDEQEYFSGLFLFGHQAFPRSTMIISVLLVSAYVLSLLNRSKNDAEMILDRES